MNQIFGLGNWKSRIALTGGQVKKEQIFGAVKSDCQ